MRFVKKTYGLPDGIHYVPDSEPRFLKPPSSTQDDLDALMSAVGGESPVVEETSTGAFAPRGRSGEPELGSLAALMQ